MTTSALQEREGDLRGQDCCKGGIDEVAVVIGRFGSAAVPKSLCFLTRDDCPNKFFFSFPPSVRVDIIKLAKNLNSDQ